MPYLAKRLAIILGSGLLVVACGDSGPPGQADSSALVELSEESSGENCKFGGQRIDSGGTASAP